jgi:hypothetical protein
LQLNWTFDRSLAESLALRENMCFQLRADLCNSFNHTNLGGLSTNTSSSSFSRLTSATSRSMPFGARLQF